MSAEEFSLEARLDFIISGLSDALQQLEAAESKIGGVVTGLGDLSERFAGTSKATEKYAADLLDAQSAVALLKLQVGELTAALNTEETAVVRGSSAWSERVRAISQSQREYATFRKNALTGAETGPQLNINNQSGQAQRDDLDTLAAKNANYASEITAAAKEIEAAEARISKATKANAYDKEIADLGQLAAAQKRAADARDTLATAQAADAAVTASDGSLLAQARTRVAVANAIEEQRAALKALTAAEEAERRAAISPTSGKANATFLGFSEGSLPRVRYALYDVSFAAAVAGAALTGAFVGAVKSAADFEAEFAQVQRTTGATGEQAKALRQDFIDLSQSIPVSFKDLSSIGALGGQLNIAASDLSDFTRVTAEFSSSTNVSIDASGTALGRLQQLLDDGKDSYEGLASSILKVGVNSVATESQIIAISQNIAGIGSTVGLTADQVIGLSGALASIGTAPESARSSVTRLFMAIQNAIDSDTVALAKFGALSGETGDQFRQAFKADAGGTLVQLLQGVNAQGDGAIAVLKELGITSVRDIPTLLKLAQNTDLLTSSLGNAKSGLTDASELSTQYGVTNSTLSAKLTILANSLQDLFAAIGGAADGPIGDLISGLTGIINTISDFASADATAPFVQIALVVVGLAATLAIGTAVASRFFASILATRTAALEFAAASRAVAIAKQQEAAATAQSTGALASNTASLNANKAAAEGVNVATKTAAVSTGLLKTALISTGIGLAVVLLGTLAAALVDYTSKAGDASKASKEYFGGDTSALASALAKDQAEYQKSGTAIKLVTTNVEENSKVAKDWVGSLEGATGAQVKLTDGTTTATSSIRSQTVAYGENAKAALAAALANSDKFQELFKKSSGIDALKNFGFDQTAFAKRLLGNPEEGGKEYARELVASIATQTKLSQAQVDKIFTLNKLGASADPNFYGKKYGVDPSVIQSLNDASSGYFKLLDASSATGTAIADEAQQAAVSASAQQAVGITAEQAAGQMDLLNGATADGTDANIAYSEALKTKIDNELAGGVASEKLGQSLETLGAAFANNGTTAALSGSAIAGVLDQIAASSSSGPEAAAQMSTLFSAIVAGGYASAAQLAPLLAAMSQLTGSAVTLGATGAPVTNMLGALKNGSAGAGKAAGGAAKQVKTLVDYSNDLAGVFSRISDIRFGPQQALDSVSAAWNDIAQSSEDAQQAVSDAGDAINEAAQKAEKARATLLGLAADKSNSEYWLNVAQLYGDAERVKQIQADLAKNTVDTAAAQGDLNSANTDATKAAKALADAQDAASMTLDGNSKAAIDNRKTITDLIGGYQKLVESWAAAGVPADELQRRVAALKQQFIAQATQAGFSRSSILNYASSFDDMTTAIGRVPRNITVTANTDPAIQALNEFVAKASSAGASAGNAFKNAFGDPSAAATAKAARGAALIAQMNDYYKKASAGQGGGGGKAFFDSAERIAAQLRSGNYYDGGFTGSGGKYEVAGAVHRGEYVFPQEAVRFWGVENLAYLHQRALRGYDRGGPVGFNAPAGGAGGSSTSLVVSQMTAGDRMFFRELFREFAGSLTVTDGVIASAASAAQARLVKAGNN